MKIGSLWFLLAVVMVILLFVGVFGEAVKAYTATSSLLWAGVTNGAGILLVAWGGFHWWYSWYCKKYHLVLVLECLKTQPVVLDAAEPSGKTSPLIGRLKEAFSVLVPYCALTWEFPKGRVRELLRQTQFGEFLEESGASKRSLFILLKDLGIKGIEIGIFSFSAGHTSRHAYVVSKGHDSKKVLLRALCSMPLILQLPPTEFAYGLMGQEPSDMRISFRQEPMDL